MAFLMMQHQRANGHMDPGAHLMKNIRIKHQNIISYKQIVAVLSQRL